ncbi:hypothetical protein BDY21DRAFT_368664 [Lineolata rhizophorae]|uniref:Uncharacterized protein n=1 Tax=Lineolata rhizophorae TaxID=578093 RepID=A0A6A6PBY5_9PEZI|nr:hypothetical protein BDY21DRAFT_368664 [Lineolata rhizophorae]
MRLFAIAVAILGLSSTVIASEDVQADNKFYVRFDSFFYEVRDPDPRCIMYFFKHRDQKGDYWLWYNVRMNACIGVTEDDRPLRSFDIICRDEKGTLDDGDASGEAVDGAVLERGEGPIKFANGMGTWIVNFSLPGPNW